MVVGGTPEDTANADECLSVHAVIEATEAINIISTLATVDLLSSVVDAEPQVVNEVQTFDNMLGGPVGEDLTFQRDRGRHHTGTYFVVQCLDAV